MKLKDLSKEELLTMGYDEIAYMVLEEYGKKMKLVDLYRKLNEVLGIDDPNLDHITDLFELLSTNKKFVMLEQGYWDLQTKHKSQVVIEDSEEEEESDEEAVEESSEEEEAETEEDIFYEGEETDDTSEDDLADLVIIDEDEELGM